MARKKKAPPAPESEAIKNSDPAVKNGLADAVGYSGGAGFPQNQGTPWSEQISQTTTIFKNLRYYLISNFRQVLNQAYVELGLVQAIVDIPVDDAFRGGVDIMSKQLDEDQIAQLLIDIDRHDDIGTAAQASKWDRLFGGGGVLIMTGQDPQQPLDVNSISMDLPLDFRAVDMWELYWSQQTVEGGFDAIDDSEDFEFFDYYAEDVHKSRVLLLKGKVAPSFIRPRLRGWGLSVVETLVRSINQYLKATDLGFEVLDEFKLDVYKIKNLVNTLLAPNGKQKVQERIQLANWQKNYQNAIVMDSEDDFDHKQLSFAGLAEAMAGIRMQVASDMRMPLTKLFGISAAGFNSGEDDIEVYNSMIESSIRSKSKYHLRRMVELRAQRRFGFIPDDLQISFKPLRMMSAEQEENVKTQKYNRLLAAKAAGEITTYEFREACNKDNLLSITLDNAGEKLNAEDPEIDKLVAAEPEPVPGAIDDGGEDDGEVPVGSAPTPKANAKPAKEAKQERTLNDRVRNSLGYEVAAFVTDGSTLVTGREPFLEKLEKTEPALWKKAKERSEEAYGEVNLHFAYWWFLRQGGKKI